MGHERLSENERRRQLLEAACALGLEQGLAGVTARNIAARAGLSSGLVFFHFGDKEGLLSALVDYLIDTITTATALSVERLRSGAPLLLPLLVELWVAGRHLPAVRAQLALGLQRYRDAVAAVAEGTDLEREKAARVAVSLMLGTALQSLVADAEDVAATIAAVTELVSLEPRHA
jgi:TetR/AcrR family transcriptional repressor of bet genes